MSQQNDKQKTASDLLPIQEGDKTYWRSLEHVAETEEFQELVHREFPAGASELADPVSRRSFLTLMGASVALAGLGTGCVRRPEEKIVPYSQRPEDLVPGLPQFYATTFAMGDEVVGLVVEAHDGRPTKIEGNTLHGASRGATSAIHQAAVLSLYDPDRTVRVLRNGEESDFPSFDRALNARLEGLGKGKGLLVLHGTSRSPAFSAMKAEVQRQFPEATLVSWDPVSNAAVVQGTELAFGRALEPVLRLERADTIVDVEADILGKGPQHLRSNKDWAARRNPEHPAGMNRLWVFEPTFTVTGGSADHRFRIGAGEAGPFLQHLAAALATRGVEIPAGIAKEGAFDAKATAALAKELAAKRGKSVIAVGRHLPAEVQALAHTLNHALGNTDQTVRYAPAFEGAKGEATEGIRKATQLLSSGQVDTLVVLGGNPAYDAPADLGFADAMAKAAHRFHLTVSPNETSAKCEWVVPETHFLEEWGDAVAVDGTYSLVQPLIQPIWHGRSQIEVLSHLAGKPRKGHEIVRAGFLGSRGGEDSWQKVLHDGVLEGSSRYVGVDLDEGAVARAAAKVTAPAKPTESSMAVLFQVDEKVHDGRFANNAWLQELPGPMTKLTWTNAAQLSPATAEAMALRNGDLVRVEVGGKAVEAGIWIQPGLADNTVSISLGYGRTHAGRVGDGRGFDAYAIRTGDALWLATGATLTKVKGKALMATTQSHGSMEGRPIVREATAEVYKANPTFAKDMVQHPPLLPLWKQHEYVGQQWGMTIDLSTCIGCNGCMVACQAENNIPVVGPEQVQNGRAMHWIRIDRYYASTNPADPKDLSEPEVVHQPVSCVQCENAPCENVCPVAATVHSKDGGLNDMVYNRCIGTRYCANNCPYKVRRFNFLDFHQKSGLTDVEKMAFNPDVTVRTRGVMEKCTYCVQRINSAKRDAKVAGLSKVPDGTITPACAQACPTDAIVFGDINDPKSRVSRKKKEARSYDLLGELNTQPRTSYLARIRNPNPELVS